MFFTDFENVIVFDRYNFILKIVLIKNTSTAIVNFSVLLHENKRF